MYYVFELFSYLHSIHGTSETVPQPMLSSENGIDPQVQGLLRIYSIFRWKMRLYQPSFSKRQYIHFMQILCNENLNFFKNDHAEFCQIMVYMLPSGRDLSHLQFVMAFLHINSTKKKPDSHVSYKHSSNT